MLFILIAATENRPTKAKCLERLIKTGKSSQMGCKFNYVTKRMISPVYVIFMPRQALSRCFTAVKNYLPV
jgi:hypothetical protein